LVGWPKTKVGEWRTFGDNAPELMQHDALRVLLPPYRGEGAAHAPSENAEASQII